MFHSRQNSSKINRLDEMYLGTMYNEKQWQSNKLLEKDGSVSIHEPNLHVLATESYKLSNELATETFKLSNGLLTPLMNDRFSVNRNP